MYTYYVLGVSNKTLLIVHRERLRFKLNDTNRGTLRKNNLTNIETSIRVRLNIRKMPVERMRRSVAGRDPGQPRG